MGMHQLLEHTLFFWDIGITLMGDAQGIFCLRMRRE
jgi:hypothetical protein